MGPGYGVLAIQCVAALALHGAAHGTMYFVAQGGNDANSGTSASAAWSSIGKVNASKFRPGDTVSFRGGDRFAGCLVIAGATNLPSSSPATPFRIRSYGSGSATLLANCPGVDHGTGGPKSAGVLIDSVSGVTWANVDLSANATATQYGILIQSSSGRPVSEIKIVNTTISGFHLDASATSDFSAEIGVFGYASNGVCGALSAITLTDNTLQGAVGPKSPDDNGIDGEGCLIAGVPNISDVTYQGNTVSDIGGRGHVANGISGNGILVNGVRGANVLHNRVHDSGANVTTCGGPGGIWAYNADAVTIQYNEVYAMTYASGACDGAGFDLDNGVTNSVLQYNYAHDNKGPGFETTTGAAASGIASWGPNTIRYNISQNDDQGATGSSGGALQLAGAPISPSVVNVYNNTIYLGNNTAIIPACISVIRSPPGGVFPTSGVVANNICSMAGTPLFYDFNGNTAPNLSFQHNDLYATSGAFTVYSYGRNNYFSFAAWAAAAPGGETGSVTTDPQFTGSPPNGPCIWTPSAADGPAPCPSDYKLSPGAPPIGLGLDLTQSPFGLDAGPRDYYGARIPAAAGTYNIGADGKAR